MGFFKDAKDAIKGAKELGDHHGGMPSVSGASSIPRQPTRLLPLSATQSRPRRSVKWLASAASSGNSSGTNRQPGYSAKTSRISRPQCAPSASSPVRIATSAIPLTRPPAARPHLPRHSCGGQGAIPPAWHATPAGTASGSA